MPFAPVSTEARWPACFVPVRVFCNISLSLSLQDFSTFYGAGLVSACVCLKGVLLLVVVRRGKGEEKTERTGKRWLGKGKMSLGFWSCGAFACMCVHVRARSRRDLALFILHVWK